MTNSLIYTPTLFSSNTANATTTTTATMILSYFKTSNTRPHKSSTVLCCSRPNYIPNHIQDPNRVRIFDTTLRDGEQASGASMTPKQKLDIAHQLAKLGVDIIEVGFPASNKADLETVKLIACEVGNAVVDDDGHIPVICGLARCHKNDIDKAWEAVQYAKFPRIHLFLATSKIHMKYKLKMSKEEVIEKARSMVAYARSLGCTDVQFSPEDAGRSDKDFLYKVLDEAVKAGATTLCIPDTVGYNWPREFGQLIADIKTNTPGARNVIISTHCHNDLGLATANTLEGAYSGARQLEVAINGIGERAGNASLEERLFTVEDLAIYNGTDNGLPILLGILGSVFDVTKGKSHYGPGGGYSHFAGRDASRAFVSGNFTGDGLTDTLVGLSSTEVKSVVEWRDFYSRTYIFVGKVVGRYYDNEGNPTKYLKGVEAKAARGAQLMEKQKKEEEKVWCDDGYPRLVQRPLEIALTGKMSKRCACYQETDLDQPGLEVVMAIKSKGELLGGLRTNIHT
ncbi:hypothetical protein LXL04_033196 [Taraxacum kok-saghyz]